MRAGSCLPVWQRTGGARSSTSWPSQGQPSRRRRDRWCRTWTQLTLRTSVLNSLCLRLLPHNCSNQAEVARSRPRNKSKNQQLPAEPCGNHRCACGTGWECCSARRTAQPERSGTQRLQWTKQYKCLLPLFCIYPFQIPSRQMIFWLLYIWSNSDNYFHYSLCVNPHCSWLLCPSCQILFNSGLSYIGRFLYLTDINLLVRFSALFVLVLLRGN